ncbi:MAG: ATP-binding cassette domain-containing protein [Tabrizicola sp.]|nr:ATP-binding cassette domain-containing protein [Tabrizicola sp.]
MLETRNLTKSFGPIQVTKGVSLKLEKGERRVILGPNGAGKTTLFNQLVGEITPNSGTIHLDGADVTGLRVADRARRGLSRSYQKNTLFDGLTIRENLGLAAAVALGKGQGLWSDPLQSPEVRETVREVAAQVDLAPYLDARVDAVSYGIRRQLEVGIALATRPKVILHRTGHGSGLRRGRHHHRPELRRGGLRRVARGRQGQPASEGHLFGGVGRCST